MKTEYQKKIDKILTPEVVEAWKIAREERYQAVIKLIEDEDELFLERVHSWIGEFLDECYSRED